MAPSRDFGQADARRELVPDLLLPHGVAARGGSEGEGKPHLVLQAEPGGFDLFGDPVGRASSEAGQFGDAQAIAVFCIEAERDVVFV